MTLRAAFFPALKGWFCHRETPLYGLRTLSGLLLLCATLPAVAHAQSVASWQKQGDRVTLKLATGALQVQICTPRVLHVRYSPTGKFPAQNSLSVIAHFPPVSWQMKATPQDVIVATSQVQADVSRRTGAVRFLDAQGKVILSEAPGGRAMTPTVLAGPTPEAAYVSQQKFLFPADEAVYGLGQHQQGLMDYRGSTVTLEQQNREVGIPFLVSSQGYGVFWDNPAYTKIAAGGGDETTIPGTQLLTADGKPGGLTAEYFAGMDLKELKATRIDPQVDFDWKDAPAAGLGHEDFSARWTGFVQAKQGGDYTFTTQADDGVRLWIDDKQVINDWSTRPVATDSATVRLAANSRHRIRMEYYQDRYDAVARLAWRPPGGASTLSWSSEAADVIDYYFIDGPKIDTVIAGYRGLTGQAPMPGRWALGYWQSKERYNTQQEWLDIAAEYRSPHEPIDTLVQDWFYWNPHPWGSHLFDAQRYPDPAAAIQTLHDKYHLHFMISVWGKFQPGTPDNPDPNYDTMQAHGFLYPASISDQPYYDAFNPEARALYWQLMRDQIFKKGVDAWWLDASEPEVDMQKFRQVPTAHGLAARVLNAWPLMHTTSVYQGQRTAAPDKRVFILTRSAYAGQQRNGAATWSGDITANWDVFAAQIPAGLNFCLSGIPYWTTDIGAFFVNYPGGSSNPEYRELFTRWFQYGAFCPIFRVHGTSTPKELWRFGPDTEKTLVKYDNLRYRLMPYIYSQAWQVTHESGTLMRALVMDFPHDKTARESKDEFLFGPSLLVCPVTKAGATSREVYLPGGAHWADFWTGKALSGGRTITAPAPIGTMPLYVRAGSIVPMGPFVQYASEKPADPMELRVYPGADGAFTLYEDENDTYHYEHGVYATIPLRWDERTQVLTLGARQGRFPGMLQHRTFHIIRVRSGVGTGVETTSAPDAIVHYTGKAVAVHAECL